MQKPAVLETGRNNYVVGDFLAEGGMGAIYLGQRLGQRQGQEAVESGVAEDVILKALLPEFTSEPAFVDLFLREARLTATLDHPNIVRTLDLVTGDGSYFIVMEYVCGCDLRTAIRRARRRGRQLSPQASVYAGVEILEALAYAHNRLAPDGGPLGLIHRDVSPSNLLVAGDGAVKLSDFGIAKLSTHRSTFYKVKGKVGYMSPEQARGEPVDARSDLFSLAVCVYEGLVGERLFAASPMTTAAQLYAKPPPRPSERRPELPPELDRVMEKALAYSPAARFQSAAEMREALGRGAAAAGFLYHREEMSAHLGEVLGGNPRSWLRGDMGDERGGGTEAYVQRSKNELQRKKPGPPVPVPSSSASLFDRPPGETDPDEDSPLPGSTFVTGTSLVSILDGGISVRRARLVTPAPDEEAVEEASEEATQEGSSTVSGASSLPDELTMGLAARRARPDERTVEIGRHQLGHDFFHEETAIVVDRDTTQLRGHRGDEPTGSFPRPTPPAPGEATAHRRTPPVLAEPTPPALGDLPLSRLAPAALALVALGMLFGLLLGWLLFSPR